MSSEQSWKEIALAPLIHGSAPARKHENGKESRQVCFILSISKIPEGFFSIWSANLVISFVSHIHFLSKSDVVHKIVVEVVKIKPESDSLYPILGLLTLESAAVH